MLIYENAPPRSRRSCGSRSRGQLTPASFRDARSRRSRARVCQAGRAHVFGACASGRLAALDRPILCGPSRKSFLKVAIGDRPPIERDWGTAAAVAASVLLGAHIVRVHAVQEMADVVRVADRIRSVVRRTDRDVPTDSVGRMHSLAADRGTASSDKLCGHGASSCGASCGGRQWAGGTFSTSPSFRSSFTSS